MNERKKASMARSHWERQRLIMEKRMRFRKLEGREEKGEQPVADGLSAEFQELFLLFFCLVGSGAVGMTELDGEKKYLNVFFYVI